MALYLFKDNVSFGLFGGDSSLKYTMLYFNPFTSLAFFAFCLLPS